MEYENELIKQAFSFIAENDEYANIIPDGKFDEGCNFLKDFTIYLHEN